MMPGDRVTLFGYPVRLLIDDVEGETVDATHAIGVDHVRPVTVIDTGKVIEAIRKARAERYCPCCGKSRD